MVWDNFRDSKAEIKKIGQIVKDLVSTFCTMIIKKKNVNVDLHSKVERALSLRKSVLQVLIST